MATTDFAAEFKSGLLDLDGSRAWALANMEVGCPILTFADFSEPTSYDPRPKIKIHNQLRMSSCVGHGTTTAVEETSRIAGAGHVELSRMACYILAQDENNIRTDSGATMEGAARALQKGCCCPEDLHPYTGVYNRNIPQAALESCRKHPCKTTRVLTNYQECLRWIKQGQGCITVGSPWLESMANHRGRVIERLSGQSLGGHCWAMCGFIESRLIQVNSHGDEWGFNGTAELTENVVDELFRLGMTAIGVSDMTHIVKPRQFMADIDFGRIIAG